MKPRCIKWKDEYSMLVAKSRDVESLFYKEGFVGGRRYSNGLAMIEGRILPVQYRNDVPLKSRYNEILIMEFDDEHI